MLKEIENRRLPVVIGGCDSWSRAGRDLPLGNL